MSGGSPGRLDELSDGGLVRLFWRERDRRRREVLFEVIWRRHLKTIRQRIRGVLSDQRDVEEVAQDAFVRVWFSLEKLEMPLAFRSWLAAIADNLARNRLKQLMRRDQPLDPDVIDRLRESEQARQGLAEDEYEGLELHEVATILENTGLSKWQQRVVIYTEVLLFSAPDTAQRLGLTAEHVRQVRKRARDALRTDAAFNHAVGRMRESTSLRLPRVDPVVAMRRRALRCQPPLPRQRAFGRA